LIAQLWCDRHGKKVGPYDPVKYGAELRTNTDFRKYDGVLRTVLDVSAKQAAAVETFLENEYRAGRLVYGIHTSETALMTCLVFNLEQGEHVHFIDGAGGGFALAAEGFKARLAGVASA
jgi:hypothetical protein